jgi:putative membrane protein
MLEQMKWSSLVSSLLYSFIGVFIFWISFLIIDRLTPYHLWKEIIEEKNTALGVMVGGIAIGICIIVAAAIH